MEADILCSKISKEYWFFCGLICGLINEGYGVKRVLVL